jgi:hypothetical protein
MPTIVLRTWKDVNENIEIYRQAFGDKFILLYNNPEDAKKDFNIELLKPYLADSKAKGKPKTPEEQAKSKQKFNDLMFNIKQMVNKLPKFDTLDVAKSKIKSFIQ